MLKSFYIYQSVAKGSQMKYVHLKNSGTLKGLNEKWHILDNFPQKTDINTDFCVLLYPGVEGGTWVIKALY